MRHLRELRKRARAQGLGIWKRGAFYALGATEAGVIAFCRDEIAHFKAPKHVVHVSELPKTSTGKVQKFELRKAAKDMGSSDSK